MTSPEAFPRRCPIADAKFVLTWQSKAAGRERPLVAGTARSNASLRVVAGAPLTPAQPAVLAATTGHTTGAPQGRSPTLEEGRPATDR
jgi:hypothetical protein